MMALPAHFGPDGEWDPTPEIGGATGAPEGLDPGGGGGTSGMLFRNSTGGKMRIADYEPAFVDAMNRMHE